MSWHKKQWGELLGALALVAATVATGGIAGGAASAGEAGAAGAATDAAGAGAADAALAGGADAALAGGTTDAGLVGAGDAAGLGTLGGAEGAGLGDAALAGGAADAGSFVAPSTLSGMDSVLATDAGTSIAGATPTAAPTSAWGDLTSGVGNYMKDTAKSTAKGMAQKEAMAAMTPKTTYTSYTPGIQVQQPQDVFAMLKQMQANARGGRA